MPSLSRRNALRAGSVAVAAGLAGCSSEPEPPNIKFDELTLVNSNPEPHTVTVLVLENDEPVYRSTMDADAARERDDGTTEAGGGEFQEYPTEPGRYELYAWYEQQASDEWAYLSFDADSLPDSEDGPLCAKVLVIVESDTEGSPRIGFFTNNDCEIQH